VINKENPRAPYQLASLGASAQACCGTAAETAANFDCVGAAILVAGVTCVKAWFDTACYSNPIKAWQSTTFYNRIQVAQVDKVF
jgi:hypothetical protein